MSYSAQTRIIGAHRMPAPSAARMPPQSGARMQRPSRRSARVAALPGWLSGMFSSRPSDAAPAAVSGEAASGADGFAATAPSLAQTFMRGPLTANGSGKALTREELDACKAELEEIKAKYNYTEPVRSFMDKPDTVWRFGGPPDYSLTNLKYLQVSRLPSPASMGWGEE